MIQERHGGGGKAHPFDPCHGDHHQLIELVLGSLGLSLLCWLLFTLTVYALPFFAGMTAGLAALHCGAGILGAFIVAILAGGAILALGRIAFATSRDASDPRRHRASLCRAGSDRRLSAVVCANGHRHVHWRIVAGISCHRRHSGRHHRVFSPCAVRPVVKRAESRGRPGSLAD